MESKPQEDVPVAPFTDPELQKLKQLPSIFDLSKFRVVVDRFTEKAVQIAQDRGDEALEQELEENPVRIPSQEAVNKLDEGKPGTLNTILDDLKYDDSLPVSRRSRKGILHVLKIMYQVSSDTER